MAFLGPEIGRQRIWDRTISLLTKTASLHYLSLDLHWLQLHDRLSARASDVQARPKDLDLRLSASNPLPAKLLDFLSEVTSQMEDLFLLISDSNPLNPRPASDLLSTVLRASHATLRRLAITGCISKVIIVDLFQHLSLLEDLSVELDTDDPASDPIPPLLPALSIAPLTSLKSLEAPAWLLPFFESRNLEAAAISLSNASDAAIVRVRLYKWILLEDLVLHFQMRTVVASEVLQGLIKVLTPSEDDSFACRRLLRLGITDRISDNFFSWLRGDSKDDFDLETAQAYQDEEELWRCSPVIGHDLLHLDKRRRQLYNQALDEATDHPKGELVLDDDVCRSLWVIRVLDFLVDPLIWTVILQDAEVYSEERWCYPDPWELQNKLAHADHRGVRSYMATALYRLQPQAYLG